MSYKDKFNKYRNKCVILKNTLQKGGNLAEVFMYISQNSATWNEEQKHIINNYLGRASDNVTIDEFKGFLRGAGYPIPVQIPLARANPIDEIFVNQLENTYLVVTTGLAYFEGRDLANAKLFVQAILSNAVNTFRAKGIGNFNIHHFDMNFPPNFTYGISPNEYSHNKWLDYTDLKKLEGVNNHLVIDFAHILYYYRPPLRDFELNGKTLVKYKSYDSDELSPNLNINSFYPGFCGDYRSIDFCNNFKYFDVVDRKIVTYIVRGYVRAIVFEFRRDPLNRDNYINCNTDRLNINISGISQTYDHVFCNKLFWT